MKENFSQASFGLEGAPSRGRRGLNRPTAIIALLVLSATMATCLTKAEKADEVAEIENRVKQERRRALERAALALILLDSPKSESGASGTSSTPCTTCRMFATATTYNGNLGGISGADAKCAADANKPASGTYKALIVDGTNRRACSTANCSGAPEGIDWVLKANTSYTRADGTAIGTTNAAAIFTPSLTNGVTTASTEYRTGMRFVAAQDWVAHATAHCTNWTSSTGTGTTGNGVATAINTDGGSGPSANFLYVNGTSCGTAVALVCVEQ